MERPKRGLSVACDKERNIFLNLCLLVCISPKAIKDVPCNYKLIDKHNFLIFLSVALQKGHAEFSLNKLMKKL